MEESISGALYDLDLCVRLFTERTSAEEVEWSRQIDRSGIHDSSVVRTCFFVRQLAGQLFDEKGNILIEAVSLAAKELRSQLYSLGPGRWRDSLFRLHVLRVLNHLREKKIQRLIQRVVVPTGNPGADYLIRQTLQEFGQVTLSSARRAVITAWMTPLRQSVGSCFATAPAIVIQAEQPERLLEDLIDLLSSGALHRGESVVPLSTGWGLGELRRPVVVSRAVHSPALQESARILGVLNDERPTLAQMERLLSKIKLPKSGVVDSDFLIRALGKSASPDLLEQARDRFKAFGECALLKSWEFSLASFVDLKSDVNRSNLYHALGLRHDEPEGLGAVVHRAIQERLEDLNRELELLDQSFDRAEGGFKISRKRVESAASQEEAQWMRADASRRRHEVEEIGEERHRVERRGQCLSHLFVNLMNRYLELMPASFQQVYDAQMQEVEVGPFDDSPAGFRLLYKHGRSNPALWSWIDGAKEFVEALVDFFVMTELQLLPGEEWRPIQSDLSFIVSQIIIQIRSPGFVEGTIERMKGLYDGNVKPWAYISGGSMSSLLGHYYERKEEVEKRGRWVDSPFDLFVMLLDIYKEVPSRLTNPLLDDPSRSILMESPTHAFVGKPGLPPFSKGWQDRGNSYTWARDQVVIPQHDFLRSIRLTHPMRRWFVDRLMPGSSVEVRGDSVASFRKGLVERMGEPFEEIVDGLLYSSLPLTPLVDVESRLLKIFSHLIRPERLEELARHIDHLRPAQTAAGFLSALELQQAAHAVWMLYAGSAFASRDLAYGIRGVMRRLGFAYPWPVLFADSNWTHDYFAFLVHPGTNELDLWRVDHLGIEGAPMKEWRRWLDGSTREEWSIYTEL